MGLLLAGGRQLGWQVGKCPGHCTAGDSAIAHVERGLETLALVDEAVDAQVGELSAEGKGGVAQGPAGSATDCAGHVGDTVVDYPVDHEDGVAVGGGVTGLETAALVYGDVYQDGSFFHPAEELPADEDRGLAARDEDRAGIRGHNTVFP